MATRCFMVASRSEAWERGVGSMFWRHHEPEPHDRNMRDMPHLAVVTTAGLFCIDCPQTDPPYDYWIRTGDPPNVSVTPSININDDEWHGYLTDGVLTP